MKNTPIPSQERIASLDIIRGFALFGILLVNMPAFQHPDLVYQLYALTPQFNEIDRWIRLLFDLFVQTKFYTIFSFLFGLGFYIFMKRAQEKGLGVKKLFARRLSILLLFGLGHLVFLWFGDILHTYALCGFLLLLFYNRSNKTLIAWAISLFIIILLISSSQLLIPSSILEKEYAQTEEVGLLLSEETVQVYQNAGYVEWVKHRLQSEVVTILLYSPLAFFVILPMFLLGFYAGRKEIFSNVSHQKTFINKVWWSTLLLSLPSMLVILSLYFNWIDFGIKNIIINELAVLSSGVTLSLFYITSLLLLLEKRSWRIWMKPIGSVGQMALTNYIIQSVIAVSIFVGLGLYGEVNLLLGLVLTVIIFPLQIIFSHYWLKSFRFGPLEWVWRTLTYGNKQPMKHSRKK